MRPTYGYAKQGAGYGYTHVKGLNALIGTLSTPTSAPVIAGDPAAERIDHLRRAAPPRSSRHLGHRPPVRRVGAGGGPDGLGVLHRRRRRSGPPGRRKVLRHRPPEQLGPGQRSPPSPTPRGPRSATRTRSGTTEAGRWVSDAEVAETTYTAFASRGARRGHRPADRAPGETATTRPAPTNPRCSPATATMRCSPTPR